MDQSIVDQQVEPYVKGYAAFNHDVSLFEFGDVIVKKNFKESNQVRLVSGGTFCHMEYVGDGMLTASIQGKGTSSPTPSLILRTLRELSVNHVNGVLVIVQASSSDLLNFGLAVERADNDDLPVRFLGVPDDCKNNVYSKAERRGLSGVVLVNKIAGALSVLDKTISEIHNYCSKVVQNLSSTATHIKKSLVNRRECLYCKKCAVGFDDVELISNPPKRVSIKDVLGDIVKELLEELSESDRLKLSPGDSIVVFVNNLGALSQQEQYVFFTHCMEILSKLEIKVVRFFIGQYVHVIYDIDITVTFLKVFDADLVSYLDAPCKVTGWIPAFQCGPLQTNEKVLLGSLRRKCRLSPPVKGPKLKGRSPNIVQLCLHFACDALISCEKMLNKMDSEIGNTGSRLRITAEVLNKRLCNKKLNTECPFTLFLSLSKVLESSVGGTSGCIYSVIFEAVANTFGEHSEEEEITAEIWLQSLENACKAVKKYGNVEFGDKTMYDPLEACAKLFRQYSRDGRYLYAFGVGVSKAEDVAQATRKPGCKFPDPGAHAVGIWMRAIYEAIKLKCIY